MLGTQAVLASVAVAAILQLTFTYAPFMQAAFETEPISLHHGAVIVAVGSLS